jgi:hypothetical protein
VDGQGIDAWGSNALYRAPASSIHRRRVAARGRGDRPIGLIYRFYELFDLPNIPKSELIQYAAGLRLGDTSL